MNSGRWTREQADALLELVSDFGDAREDHAKTNLQSAIYAEIERVVQSNVTPSFWDGGEWWITTNWFRAGGEKVLGPFETSVLAQKVRTYMERAEGRHDFFIDREPS